MKVEQVSTISVDDALVETVIKNNWPFTIVESESFRQFIEAVRRMAADEIFPIRSAATLKNWLQDTFNTRRNKLQLMLQACNSISLSVDCWTSPNNMAFLGMIVHFIDDEWVYREKVLDFVKLDGEHTGANMAHCIATVLKEWSIDDKLLSITCDNAENNSTLVGQLVTDLPQSRISMDNKISCLAHTVQLIANSILATVGTQTMCEIEKVRSVILFIGRSPQRLEQWNNVCVISGLERNKLQYDVKTRWNSTLRMIKEALGHRRAVDHYITLHHELSSYQLTDDEWAFLRQMAQCLELFETITLRMSLISPQITHSLPIYYKLQDELEKMSNREEQYGQIDSRIAEGAKRGLAKFQKYYYKMDSSDAYYIATSLDPRFKQHWFESQLEKGVRSDLATTTKQRAALFLPGLPRPKRTP